MATPSKTRREMRAAPCREDHRNARMVRLMYLVGDLEGHLELHRRAEWQAGDAVDRSNRVLVLAEHVLEHLGGAIGYSRMITHVTHSGDEHAEPNDARHPIERPEMVADDREDVEGGEPRRSAARFRVELRTDASDEFR